MFAEIVVNVPRLTTTFHYAIPEWLQGRLRPGHLVVAPFGERRAQGIVVALADEAAVREVKTIEALVDPEPVVTLAQLDLAYWLSHTYLAPLIDCLALMLPPGLSKRADVLYALVETDFSPTTEAQKALLRLLRTRGPLRGRQLDHWLPRMNWRSAADQLARRGVLEKQPVLDPPSVRPKHVRTLRLTSEGFQSWTAGQAADGPGQPFSRSAEKAVRMQAVLDFLVEERGGPVDVSWAYAQSGAKLADLKDLAERGLVDLGEVEVWRDPLADTVFVPTDPPELTQDQQRVWEAVRAGLEVRDSSPGQPPDPYLLHGVTGSGKTEIYLRAVGEVLRQGQRAIVLVPEISLTPQTVRRFAARFPGRVTVWHSQLSAGERYDTWRRARAGLVDIVIGPRSALFAPLPDLRLIVLDEEHDEAYHQDPPLRPYYHARATAVEYARRLGAVCILGTATPDLVSYHRSERGEYRRLELPQRIFGHTRRLSEQAARYGISESRYRAVPAGPSEARYLELPPVEVVDMRQELRAGNTSMFSRALQSAMSEALAGGGQVILFLNRRGTSTYVFCRDCGGVLKCSRCDMPLTYHGAGAQLACHHCNYRRAAPSTCPNCQSTRIRHFGAGTQRVEDNVRRLFPEARTLRWDRDETRAKGAHDLILQHFVNHQADVLIGTQMVAKGLDLPLVTLVGVISADTLLGLPDYRAAERTFQTLTQVAGRAGRGLLGGRVIFQTYNPDHYAIRAAAGHNYGEFYRQEIRYRRELVYPPFGRLARLECRGTKLGWVAGEVERVARGLREQLSRDDRPATTIIGPAPCFFAKVGGEYRWQIILRGPDPGSVLRPLPLAREWRVEIDPTDTL